MPRLAGIVQHWRDGSLDCTTTWRGRVVSFGNVTSWSVVDGRVKQLIPARIPGSSDPADQEPNGDGQGL